MNIEELEKEAEEFEENYTIYEVAKRKDGTDYAKKTCRVTIKEAYLAGAEPREKRIAELEEQIEKVKHYLDYDMPIDFINGATIMICRMLNKESKE